MSDASTLFEQLAAKHRRRILLLLCERDALRVPGDVRSRGQARATPTADGGPGRETPPAAELETRLRHVDLPKLAAAGLIEWNPGTGIVSRGPRFADVEPALRLLADNPERFPLDLL